MALADPARQAALPRLPLRPNDFDDQVLAEAAVLVGLVDHGSEDRLLLTERAHHLRNHAGQVSFPGGRTEPADANLVTTALRELHEETGIAPASVEVLGQLPQQVTISAFKVTPIVARIDGPQVLTLDPGEVHCAFEVPLAFFLDATKRKERERQVRDVRFQMPEWQFEGQRIWGATAWIIDNLINMIKNNE